MCTDKSEKEDHHKNHSTWFVCKNKLNFHEKRLIINLQKTRYINLYVG